MPNTKEIIASDDSTSEPSFTNSSARRTLGGSATETTRSSIADESEHDASKKRRRRTKDDSDSSTKSVEVANYLPALMSRSKRQRQRSPSATTTAPRPPMRVSLLQRIKRSALGGGPKKRLIPISKYQDKGVKSIDETANCGSQNVAKLNDDGSSNSRESMHSDLSDSSDDLETSTNINKSLDSRLSSKSDVRRASSQVALIGERTQAELSCLEKTDESRVSKRKKRPPSRFTSSTGAGCADHLVRGSETARSGAQVSSSQRAAQRSTVHSRVENALREVRHKRKHFTESTLSQMLTMKNKKLKEKMDMKGKPIKYARLPRGENQPFDSSFIQEKDYPTPIDTHHTVFLRKNFSSLNNDGSHSDGEVSSAEESVSPTRSPTSPGPAHDAAKEDIVKRLLKQLPPAKKKFAKAIAEFWAPDRVGAGYEEADVDNDIDNVLKSLRSEDQNSDGAHEHLATILQEDVRRIKRRWEKTFGLTDPRRQHSSAYEDVMSSFRDLFCRRCLTFDCNLHGLPEDLSPDIQAELAVGIGNPSLSNSVPPLMCYPVKQGKEQTKDARLMAKEVAVAPELTETQKQLCQRLYHLFQNDLGKVSEATGIPVQVIGRQMTLEPFKFNLSESVLCSNLRTKQNKTNSYHPEWIRRIEEATSHPFFNPCSHHGPCSEEICPCIQNRFFCTKACLWGATSRNYFRGCNCNSKCNARSCPCFASNRECDPDLCTRCNTCSDPGNGPACNQKCRNDNIGMRRHVHLLLGKSEVAGWGLFTKYALAKGDYVHEYLGELIPHNEAERRGKIYDERNQTYIFDMSTDYAVDALSKGNKTRFINHSDNPNIGPQMKVVNGDFRIGFFAIKDIPAQTELFFHYGDKFFKAASRGFNIGSNQT